MATPISGVDVNGVLAKDIDDYINARIYSMLGTCTKDSLLQYQLDIAQKSICHLQKEVNDLQFKLQIQTVKYEQAKEEASMNASALKRSIAKCQNLKEQRKKWMQKGVLLKTSPEQRRELFCNVRRGKRLRNRELQLGRPSSSDHLMTVYGDDNKIPKKQTLITSEGLKVDERQSTRKSLLHKLDLNAEDSNYRLTTLSHSVQHIRSSRPPRKEGKKLNSEKACQQNLPEIVDVEVDEMHSVRNSSLRELDSSSKDLNCRLKGSTPSTSCSKGLNSPRKEVKHLNTTEKTCQWGILRAEIEVDEMQSNQSDERQFNGGNEKSTRKRQNDRLGTSTHSINCTKSPKSPRKKVELLNSIAEICQQDLLNVETQGIERCSDGSPICKFYRFCFIKKKQRYYECLHRHYISDVY